MPLSRNHLKRGHRNRAGWPSCLACPVCPAAGRGGAGSPVAGEQGRGLAPTLARLVLCQPDWPRRSRCHAAKTLFKTARKMCSLFFSTASCQALPASWGRARHPQSAGRLRHPRQAPSLPRSRSPCSAPPQTALGTGHEPTSQRDGQGRRGRADLNLTVEAGSWTDAGFAGPSGKQKRRPPRSKASKNFKSVARAQSPEPRPAVGSPVGSQPTPCSVAAQTLQRGHGRAWEISSCCLADLQGGGPLEAADARGQRSHLSRGLASGSPRDRGSRAGLEVLFLRGLLGRVGCEVTDIRYLGAVAGPH